MNLTMRQLGGAIGAAVVITVIGNSGVASVDDFRVAWGLLAAGLFGCVVLVGMTYPSRRPRAAVG